MKFQVGRTRLHGHLLKTWWDGVEDLSERMYTAQGRNKWRMVNQLTRVYMENGVNVCMMFFHVNI